jgi:RimJ/RimL family protein N-acetyltransferase
MATVRLRPLRLDDLEPLWEARQADETAFPTRVQEGAKERLRDRLTKDLSLEQDGWLELGIEIDGRLIGDVQARHPKNAMPPGVYEIGITLFGGERGKGYGRLALEQFTDVLFRDHAAGRVQGSTAVENGAMRRVFEILGWTAEGVLREFWPGEDGSRADYALYAITRSDWESRNPRSSSDT